uniref:Uncharacterized protein LOC104235234 n=1 Tax=Nicotiana sylvestris TaxID=4096 RepID=A0A1U7X576_NICSY|nr:PREDICTED: uncharacterized protein LOC104235234 [Nicotiana sylvestris]
MAKNQITTKDYQYKKIFKVENAKKQSPKSEIEGKSNMVLIDYNHTPGKVQQKQEPKGNKSNGSRNDKYFSGYIDRVKNKMRTTTSSVGNETEIRKVATRRDSFNDRISHYINRAKLKIRTTTIVGRGDQGVAN